MNGDKKIFFLVTLIFCTHVRATQIVRDQYWPWNSNGVYQSPFIFPEGVVSDVTVGGILDHVDIPIGLTYPNTPSGQVLHWSIYDAKNGMPLNSTVRASGTIPVTDVSGPIAIPVSTFGLLYHPGDQFTFAIQGDGDEVYSWYSYRGFDAKVSREYRLIGGAWSLDEPPLNPPPSYAAAYSTFFAVPEPTTATLLLLGMLGCVGGGGIDSPLKFD